MADLDLGNVHGVVDKREGRGNTGSSDQLAEVANANTIAAAKTRLAAISGTTFTAARLATMTKNDLLFALRKHSADTAGLD